MNVTYQQLARKLKLVPGDTNIFSINSGTPYRHLTTWVWLHTVGTIEVTAQPKFGGEDDGLPTVINNNVPTKVLQVPQEEVRPPSRFNFKFPDDSSIVQELKSELNITNTRATALVATYTWNGTTTITSGDTSEVDIGEWIRLDSDGQWFKIISISAGVSVTVENPNGLTIPTGATQSSVSFEVDVSLYMLAAATPGGA